MLDEQNTKRLFNGRDLEGWEHVGPGRFEVEDGRLKTVGGMGLLWYTREAFGDCVLEVVYRTTKPDSNSGVFIRIADKPADEWFAVHNGYEVQILDTAGEYHRTGCIYSLAPATATASNPPGEWNRMEIALDGNIVRVSVNGVLVTNFDPDLPAPEKKQWYEPERGPRPTRGYIGLQNHDEGSTVFFREVNVRPLA